MGAEVVLGVGEEYLVENYMAKQQAIAELERHADSFLQGGLWAYTGYFPNDFYGKEGEKYYRWSKRTFDLIRQLGESDEPKGE